MHIVHAIKNMGQISVVSVTFVNEAELLYDALRRNVRCQRKARDFFQLKSLKANSQDFGRHFGRITVIPELGHNCIGQLDFGVSVEFHSPESGPSDELARLLTEEVPDPETVLIPVIQIATHGSVDLAVGQHSTESCRNLFVLEHVPREWPMLFIKRLAAKPGSVDCERIHGHYLPVRCC